jgi:N-acetylneuraminic acid mutarotase
MAGKQGDTDGVAMDQRSPENNSLMAPAKGGGTWTQKADMPTKRSNCGAVVVDGKIYVIGGWVSTAPWDTTAAVEEYNPRTDTWTINADMPTKGTASASAVNGIIYAIIQDGSAVAAYDPAADKWTKKASMPTKRLAFANAVVDGKICIIGGFAPAGGHKALSTVEVYDPATDKWTRKADMQTARLNHAACVIDGKIYVSGGSPTWEWGNTIPTVEVYDPATDTWFQSKDMPWPRQCHTANEIDGKMYIIGGKNSETVDLVNAGKVGVDELVEQFSSVDVYDPATDIWTTTASIPTPRDHPTSILVDGKIYVIGGIWDLQTLLSTVEEYDPSLSGNIAITSPAGKLLRTWGEVKSE